MAQGTNNIIQGLQKVASELQNWSTNILGDLEKRLKIVKRELEEVRRSAISPLQVSRELFLREKLERLEHQRDLYWKQRSHVNWLKSGDKNTKYFHAFASERKKRNTIRQLKNGLGRRR